MWLWLMSLGHSLLAQHAVDLAAAAVVMGSALPRQASLLAAWHLLPRCDRRLCLTCRGRRSEGERTQVTFKGDGPLGGIQVIAGEQAWGLCLMGAEGVGAAAGREAPAPAAGRRRSAAA